MAEYNWVDYLIIFFVVISMASGLARGLVQELISFFTWIGGLILAVLFTKRLAAIMLNSEIIQSAITTLSQAIGKDCTSFFSILSLSISFIALFAGTMIIGNILGMVLRPITAIPGIGLINNLLGLVFGFIRGIFFIILFLLGMQYFEMKDHHALANSKLTPYFKPSVSYLNDLVQPHANGIKSIVGNVKSFTSNILS